MFPNKGGGGGGFLNFLALKKRLGEKRQEKTRNHFKRISSILDIEGLILDTGQNLIGVSLALAETSRKTSRKATNTS